MSDDKNNGADGLPAETGSEPSGLSLEEQIRQAEVEAADLKDRLLRALAETENVRRRA